MLRAGNVGDAALSAGQHCGLDQERAGKHTMCNAQYLLEAGGRPNVLNLNARSSFHAACNLEQPLPPQGE